MRLLWCLCLIVASTMLATSAAPQQRAARVALVIGNANYPDASTPLSTSLKDARTLAEEFRRNKFDVDLKENLGKEAMQRAIEAFAGKITSGAAALFYFNGYGLQVGRQTYLVPVNAQLWTEADVRRDGISVDAVLAEMHRKGAKTKIIILDAARRNPFERRFRTAPDGLASLNAPEGTLAVFPAAPGKVTPESTGANSVFTNELLKELRSPNSTAEEIFNRTRVGVARVSSGEQVPWVLSSLSDDFYFGTPRAADSARPGDSYQQTAEPPVATDANTAMRRDYELAAQIGSLQAWDSFLALYPKGFHADLARAAREKIVTAERAAGIGPAKGRSDEAEKSQSSDAAADRAKADAAKRADPADPLRLNLVTDCDRLTAARFDPQRPRSVAGVDDNKIVIGAALAACGDAVRQYPGVARFVFQSGRVASVQKDRLSARRFFETASNMGSGGAMNALGLIYMNGNGVPKDYAEARKWYDKALDAGYSPALTNIGLLYRHGWGVPQDYVEARKWFEKAVAAGLPGAMINLGILYERGLGVTQDYAEARKWYQKAVDAGQPSAMSNIAWLYQNGFGVAQDYAEARKLYQKAADAGQPQAMTNLGWFYQNGRGVAQDFAEARRWYEKAAALGDAAGMNNLGTLYENGRGTTKDLAEARKWYQKAADAGNERAKDNLKRLPSPN
jgi:TPR repeat protein